MRSPTLPCIGPPPGPGPTLGRDARGFARWRAPLWALSLGAMAGLLGGCALVPQHRRAALADPLMSLEDESLEAHRKAKLYSTREGAAGGDGTPAGGGCGCQ